MKKLILLFILFIPINVFAKDDFMIDCDQNKYNEFVEFNCYINVNSSFSFNKIEFEINPTVGLSLDEIRSNYRLLWKVETKDNHVTATTVGNQLVSGLQEFGIILFQTMSSGDQKIEITKIVLSGNNKTLELKDTTENIKVLSSENKLKGISVNNNSIPNFSAFVNNYYVDITKDAVEVNLSAVPLNDTAIIEGIGNIKLDLKQDEFVLPIYITSASGVRRVYLVHLQRKDAPALNITASNIAIFNGNNQLNFKFNPSVFEYNVEVEDNVSKLKIEASLNNSNLSFVKGYGSTQINIEEGDNVVFIKIKNSEGKIKTYTLNITRTLSNKSSNCYLKELTIKGHKLSFNKRVKKYDLAISAKTKELVINAIAEHKFAGVTIIGNENLNDGSVIKILVTAENGSKLTYQINIKYKTFNYGLLILVMGILIALNFANEYRKKKQKAKSNVFEIPVEKIEPIVLPKKKTSLKEKKEEPTLPAKKKSLKTEEKKIPSTKKTSATKTVTKKTSTKAPIKKGSSVKKSTVAKTPVKSKTKSSAQAKVTKTSNSRKKTNTTKKTVKKNNPIKKEVKK